MQTLTDGDDSGVWLPSAAKRREVRVQSGSYRVMLSLRRKDKQAERKADERRQERWMRVGDADRNDAFWTLKERKEFQEVMG